MDTQNSQKDNAPAKARLIALYLPQFHEIPENDRWWGKGFTEWTNVRRAKPSFKGHYQPRVPTDLGYYNLLNDNIKEQQAQLAKDAGIEGFCYYHYWFGNGKQLLERPFQQVIESGKPDFPFCLCWANHTWSNKTWEKSSAKVKESILIEQQYGGIKDYTEHFYALLDAFKDKRYMTIDGRLIFMIYDTIGFTDVTNFINVWRQLAKENGLPGFYFIGMSPSTLTYQVDEKGKQRYSIPNTKSSAQLFSGVLSKGFDAVNSLGKRRGEMLSIGTIHSLWNKILVQLHIKDSINYDYERTVSGFFAPEDRWENVFPTIMPQWDRTARVGKADGVYMNSTPQKFQKHLHQACEIIKHKAKEHQVIIIKSWNEWAEGNYLEPDSKFGHQYLDAIRNEMQSK